MFAAQGALAALYRRTVTGEGQVVDAALTESCLAVQESTIPDYDVGGVVRGPSGTRLEGIAPSNIYRTADGSWVVIAANQDTVFRRLCAAMGRPELATDERFANHVARGRNQDELDKIIGDWAARAQPADIIATLSQAGVISGPINTVAEVVEDPQLRARGMIADHWDERIGRNVKGPGVVPVLSETPGNHPQRRLGAARASTTTRSTAGCSASSAAELDELAGGGGAVSELPDHVDIREVSLRDGLQIEEPIPLSAKLELLEAVAATGVREMEATAFVSPSKVPALADAAELAAELHDFDDIEFSALVASPNGAKRAIAAGLRLDRVRGVGRRRAQPRQRRAHHRGGHRADRRDRRDRARQRRHRRGHHRHRVGLPVRRPDTAAAGGGHRRRQPRRRRRRPARDRRHHRHHHAAAGQRSDRTGAPGDRRHPARRALPQHPRRRTGQRLRRGAAPG